MFLEHVRLSPCASLNKSGCIKGSGRSKIDILHLPTKMRAQGATINRWALQYSIYSNIRTDNVYPIQARNTLVLVTWALLENYSEEWRKMELGCFPPVWARAGLLRLPFIPNAAQRSFFSGVHLDAHPELVTSHPVLCERLLCWGEIPFSNWLWIPHVIRMWDFVRRT